MKPCKHLDYDGSYPGCSVETMAPHYPEVRYWQRPEEPVNNNPNYAYNPLQVQFCRLRGRINSVFACYNPAEMSSCYEAE